MRNSHPCILLLFRNNLISYNEKDLVSLLKPPGIIEYSIDTTLRGLHSDYIQLRFHCHKLLVLLLQFRVANQSAINLPGLPLRSLVVYIPDQIVLGKGLGHRQYYF